MVDAKVRDIINAWRAAGGGGDSGSPGNARRLLRATAAFTILVMLTDSMSAWAMVGLKQHEAAAGFLYWGIIFSFIATMCAFHVAGDSIIRAYRKTEAYSEAPIAIPAAGIARALSLVSSSTSVGVSNRKSTQNCSQPRVPQIHRDCPLQNSHGEKGSGRVESSSNLSL
ncbi:hypothetical protein VTJ04DRAFT_9659 [Mycothermus thermophilus]|uniref:uncharacterized protein n=1 Tax=Humicola insolens TaxID=85995 RepID=UPI00374467B4